MNTNAKCPTVKKNHGGFHVDILSYSSHDSNIGQSNVKKIYVENLLSQMEEEVNGLWTSNLMNIDQVGPTNKKTVSWCVVEDVCRKVVERSLFKCCKNKTRCFAIEQTGTRKTYGIVYVCTP